MGKRGFTLIELSIVLTIIGLMIGGSFKVMKMMREKAKMAEAKEQVLGVKNAVLGYASKEYFLPLNSEFDGNLSTSKDPNHPIFYTADNNLKYDDICAFTTTSLKVNNRGITIDKVAFVIAHEGANYNLQTGLDANNTVKIYSPSDKVDDNTTIMNNANHEYDDIVEWVTLDQLKNEIGCVDKPFKFITDKLPNAKVGVLYPDLNISAEAKLMVENNISAVNINCSPTSQKGINFISANFSGTPTEAGTATFNCSATEAVPSSRVITKEFLITIDPNYNKETNATCTLDSECSGGYCVNNRCSSGLSGNTCINGGDCVSGYCASGVCVTGAAGENCDDSGDCQSGLCINSICQAGAIGDACSNNNNCLSGFCADVDPSANINLRCTTGVFNDYCDNGGDCKSGICQGGLCSGYMGDTCTANAECLSGYCDSNRTCASIPVDSNGSSSGGGGGGGGGTITYTVSSISNGSYTLNGGSCKTGVTNGVASGTYMEVFKFSGCDNWWLQNQGLVNDLDTNGNTVVNCNSSGACN